MNRRTFLVSIISAASLGAAPAYAKSLSDQVVRALKKQGYSEIEVGRTWLRRLRITATKNGRRREIILNSGTGEVLRDIIYNSGGSQSNSVYDDDDDKTHDGDDGDNSGHGNDDDDSHDDD